jgi:hypothetical protein
MRTHEPLRFGRMYYRQISGDGQYFGLPYGTTYTLAFSGLLYGQEMLVAYNVSGQPRNDYVIVDLVQRDCQCPQTSQIEKATQRKTSETKGFGHWRN